MIKNILCPVDRSLSSLQAFDRASPDRSSSSVADRVRTSAARRRRRPATRYETATWQLPIFPARHSTAAARRPSAGPASGTRYRPRPRCPRARTRRPAPASTARGLPRRIGDEVLQGLVTDRIAQPAVPGLHRLAPAVVEEPFEVLTRGGALGRPTEAGAEAIHERPEAFQQRARRPRRHATNRRELARSVQVRRFRPAHAKVPK